MVVGGSYLVGGDSGCSGLFRFGRICSGCSGWVVGGSYLVGSDLVWSGLVGFGRICSGGVRGGLWEAPIWSGGIRCVRGWSGLVGFVQLCSVLFGGVRLRRSGRGWHWSVPCSVVGERRYHGVRTGVGGQLRMRALRTELGLGPRSSLGRRSLGREFWGVVAGLRLLGADSRSGAGMTEKGRGGNDGERRGMAERGV